jgi:hypothetical protein
MSPRVIQMPLSGSDRKHYARKLRRVESLHAELVKKLEAAQSAAEEFLRLAHRLQCEEWNARQFLGGDEAPSPAIADREISIDHRVQEHRGCQYQCFGVDRACDCLDNRSSCSESSCKDFDGAPHLTIQRESWFVDPQRHFQAVELE